MGEVYQARDTKLNRDVALKVLPDLFASDPDRLARFQRKAEVLAYTSRLEGSAANHSDKARRDDHESKERSSPHRQRPILYPDAGSRCLDV